MQLVTLPTHRIRLLDPETKSTLLHLITGEPDDVLIAVTDTYRPFVYLFDEQDKFPAAHGLPPCNLRMALS